MSALLQLENRIFNLKGGDSFDVVARDVFCFQYDNNIVYRKFCDALGRTPGVIDALEAIPFLPIELFKIHRIVSFTGKEKHVFTSSGTTGSRSSRHFVVDLSIYERSFMESFRKFYGEPAEYCILALLPAYLERKGSSLVSMANELIDASGHQDSGFYLDELEVLSDTLNRLMAKEQKVLLLGVSFALLEFAERFPMPLHNTIIMETGGMKGRRREMVRAELHQVLCSAFQQEVIHSEYGMTELFSQAYSRGNGLFATPPWMRVLIRDSNDPLDFIGEGRTGGINVIDLANLHSCSFIATQDLGKLHPGGLFEVLGRFDHSDVRGCNLMVEG
jgi:phenylacetate-coenzyme A ligase PaaK-like adenylate-forming protein